MANKKWMKLDNSAKIYPAARKKNWTNMFRLSATLTEDVDPAVLQSAFDAVAPRFPSMICGIHRGLFWYYLEQAEKAPAVIAEGPFPCKTMKLSELRKCALRVIYYKNRIAVEIFHALADGNGGLVFLKTLVAEYLTRKYGITIPNSHGILSRAEDAPDDELTDDFLKYEGDVADRGIEPNTYNHRGHPYPNGFLRLTTGIIDVSELKEIAASYDVTITNLLTAVMIKAFTTLQEKTVPNIKHRRQIRILVPVNLRKFYKSNTLRNFVMFVTPGIDPRQGEFSLEEIMNIVYHQMGMSVTSKNMNAVFSANVKIEKMLILKITPLFIKNLAMKIAYNKVGEKKNCICLSNLGVVTLPDEMSAYVTRFDFVLGAQATHANNCGVISYNGKLCVSIIGKNVESDLEREFFRILRGIGAVAKIESNAPKNS